VHFQILGSLEAGRSGDQIDLGSSRQRQVLALLLTRPNHLLSFDLMIDDLWLDSPPPTARHTLQAYVHRLRKTLGTGVVETQSQGYRLRVSDHEIDALRFQHLVEQARLLPPDQPFETADLLGQALKVWRGRVFADVPDLPALDIERARLDTMRVAALERRVEADLALGRDVELIPELEALVSENPFRERFWGQLMLALYRSDRQAEALRTFQRARKTLGEELGIEPGRALVELEGRILLHHTSLSLPRAEEDRSHTNNLPPARTSFVGRGWEIAEIRSKLQTERLVTITGPPGVGKTRLATVVAEQTIDDYPHGVFFVSLAETEEPHLIASAIASTLGVSSAGHEGADASISYLQARRLLLVVDNFEHLQAGAGLIVQLLDACPGLVVLATSRTPLHLSGEMEYPLGPLPLAHPEALGIGQVDNAAVALFADRARAVNPDFMLTTENAQGVARLVNALDRLPLAIELAAARLRSSSLSVMVGKADQLLPQLDRGPVDAPARQRTLTDAIQWSHDLLDSNQQLVFRRLGVFRGGFTIDQAETVISDLSGEEVLVYLADLVEASLVDRPLEGEQQRFSLLETIRAYALRMLEAAGELEGAARRHADVFAALVEQAEPELTRRNQAVWLDRLTVESPNLRAALAWAKDRDPAMGLLMAGRLWRFWQIRGNLPEGRRWLEEMLEEAGDKVGVPQVKGLIGLAGICYWQGDFEVAESSYWRALSLLDTLDAPLLRAEALLGQMSTLACHRGDIDTAIPLERELHDLATEHQQPAMTLMDLEASGSVRFYTGDWKGARHYMEQILQKARETEDQWLEREIHLGLASVAYLEGRLDEAERHLHIVLALAIEMGHLPGVGLALTYLGLAAVMSGRAEDGVTLVAAASRVQERVGGGLSMSDVSFVSIPDPLDLARASLDEVEIAAAWAKGWVMSLEELTTTVVGSEG